jgi:exopolysaccharide biosynthesis WecB/TagA/CpsF family protein
MTGLGQPSTTDSELADRSSVAGVLVSHTTYTGATQRIIKAASAGLPLLVAATSVHGVATAALNPGFGSQLNSFDMLTPDGQPIRWALNLLHGAQLSERVYGPTLMLSVCRQASARGMGVYLYGGRLEVLERLASHLQTQMPDLIIAGYHSPPFRPTTAREDAEDVQRILQSGASITFVGLGCPRQEQWAFAHRDRVCRRRVRLPRTSHPSGTHLDAGPRAGMAVPLEHRAASPLATIRDMYPRVRDSCGLAVCTPAGTGGRSRRPEPTGNLSRSILD